MPQPKSDEANDHARESLERAAASPKGLRITFPSLSSARAFRFACYTIRSRTQRRNLKIYPQGDPMHGRSPWDKYSLTIHPRGEQFAVEIKIPTLDETRVEEL